MLELIQRHIAVGGNRHTAAADWKEDLFAFGSGRNVALWQPQNFQGVNALLRGHTDDVSAVRILSREGKSPVIVSGSADKTVRLWSFQHGKFTETFQSQHEGAVNAIAVLPGSDIFVTGAADATLKVWQLKDSPAEATVSTSATLLQTIPLKPRFLPLALAVAALNDGSIVFAVAGTSTSIHLYHGKDGLFTHSATLTGHEGWVRSLDFVREDSTEQSDLLLASASQDRYIRLWRFHRGQELPTARAASQDPSLGVLAKSLSNRPHYLGQGESIHSVTFEALLIGHEDWIYTAQWKSGSSADTGPELLTTSADNSVSLWKREVDSGFWICQTRLGEISAEKGSTTATGSTGGFWIGLWSPQGNHIASLGRTGSWRLWRWESSSDSWQQQVGISGHTKEVKSLAWSTDGSFLLTTASDQTTRLLAPWRRGEETSWHEAARPQIHGYDLNCVDTLGTTQFISGADEKLLRVFNKPRSTAELIANLGGTTDAHLDSLPEIANIPVLGLSNKAMTADDTNPTEDGTSADKEEASAAQDVSDSDHPPHENVLSRYTLWPEHEKLYGHGYEISCVAASHDGALVATACRASSIDHAVIRLYETKDWREIRPALSSHNLTVTSLAFSPCGNHLLSVGRDRQWTVFSRGSGTTFEPTSANPKGHSRMILDCTWVTSDVFATAGRDKTVKLWVREAQTYSCKLTIPLIAAATAIATLPTSQDAALVACGSDDGEILIASVDLTKWTIVEQTSLPPRLRPAGPVTALRWRPGAESRMLAAASEDHSVRLYEVR